MSTTVFIISDVSILRKDGIRKTKDGQMCNVQCDIAVITQDMDGAARSRTGHYFYGNRFHIPQITFIASIPRHFNTTLRFLFKRN